MERWLWIVEKITTRTDILEEFIFVQLMGKSTDKASLMLTMLVVGVF